MALDEDLLKYDAGLTDLRRDLAKLHLLYRRMKREFEAVLRVRRKLQKQKSEKSRCSKCGRRYQHFTLSPEAVAEIKAAHRPGVPGIADALSEKFGVHRETIRDIWKGKSHKHAAE